MTTLLARILPPTKLERDLAFQCVLSAFATGSFLTGTAVFFTQIVGLTGAQVGLGMSLQWGGPGWAVIALIAVTAAVVAHPAARAAERFVERAQRPEPAVEPSA